MTSNPLRILVDTNIWLDIFLPQRPQVDEAKTFFRTAEGPDCELMFTLQTACDVYAKTGIDHKKWVRQSHELTQSWALAVKQFAWDNVEAMQRIATVVGADGSDLWLACKLREIHDDLEDDLILAACERAKVDYLVTRDKKLITDAPVAALTPQKMTLLLKTRQSRASQAAG